MAVRTSKFIQRIEERLPEAGGGERGMGSFYVMAVDFLFGVMKTFWK